jgi:activating signal cointegrator complex subunit 1
LEGLKAMHTPARTSILYISPTDPGNRLQEFCESIKSVFEKAELLVLDNHPLLLHATVANTIYASGRRLDGRGHGPKRNDLLTLNAEELIESYYDIIWADDVSIESVDICRIGAKKVLDIEGKDTGEVYMKLLVGRSYDAIESC